MRTFMIAALLLAGIAPASALTCRDPAGFDKWLGDVRREAMAEGVSARAVDGALAGVSYDPDVVRRDRGQGVFRQSFEQFSGRMVSQGRLTKGAAMLQRHAALLAGIERRFGVPGPVLVAIWGLETDFGVVRGNFATVRSVASLAFDCRRTEMFQRELFAILKVIDRGDLRPSDMRGAWAGELGQTQFMPTSYLKYAIDGDGDGHADLLRSPADVLTSTANYLKGYGWQAGAGWEPGQPNFEVIRAWNKSQVYARTLAYYATRLDGGSGRAGRGVSN